MSNSSSDERDRKRREEQRESGLPGGGAGRRDEVGGSGVYPMSGSERPKDPNAPIRDQASWGQGSRGAAGYEDSGESEIFYMPGELTEEAVGQGDDQKGATDTPIADDPKVTKDRDESGKTKK